MAAADALNDDRIDSTQRNRTMKQEDAQAVAKYIAQALGKTGINIKLCISRLEHYTHGISPADLDKFIRTAFRYNQESPAKAESYLNDILLQHGVENPLIWWRE